MDKKDSLEDRRRRVAALLHRAVDEKLMQAGDPHAEAALREAAALAEDLAPPWPQLVSYRLAHVVMRKARDDRAALQQAIDLFAQASTVDALGPWPTLYRAAALAASGLDRTALQEELARTAARVHAWRGSGVGGAASVGYGETDPRLHDEPQNLLEILSYAVGLPDAVPVGVGVKSRVEDERREAFILLGPDPRSMHVRMRRELAIAERDARGASEPDAILYEVDSNVARWRLPGAAHFEDANATQLWLLAALQTQRYSTVERLRSSIRRHGDESAFRQDKTRLAQKLGIETRALWVVSPEHGRLRLNPRVRAYGVVDQGVKRGFPLHP